MKKILITTLLSSLLASNIFAADLPKVRLLEGEAGPVQNFYLQGANFFAGQNGYVPADAAAPDSRLRALLSRATGGIEQGMYIGIGQYCGPMLVQGGLTMAVNAYQQAKHQILIRTSSKAREAHEKNQLLAKTDRKIGKKIKEMEDNFAALQMLSYCRTLGMTEEANAIVKRFGLKEDLTDKQIDEALTSLAKKRMAITPNRDKSPLNDPDQPQVVVVTPEQLQTAS